MWERGWREHDAAAITALYAEDAFWQQHPFREPEPDYLARVFAEGTRSAFSAIAVEGLPAERRFTASFGVAERAAGEGFGALLGRADQALYAAKNAGRDCVRLAAGPPKPIALRLTG